MDGAKLLAPIPNSLLSALALCRRSLRLPRSRLQRRRRQVEPSVERRAGSRAPGRGPEGAGERPHRAAPTALGEHAAQPRCASAPAFPAGSAVSPLLASPSSLCLASLLFSAWHPSFCSLASLLPLPGIPPPPAWHSFSSLCLAFLFPLPGILPPSTWHPSSLYLASLILPLPGILPFCLASLFPPPGIPHPLDWHPLPLPTWHFPASPCLASSFYLASPFLPIWHSPSSLLSSSSFLVFPTFLTLFIPSA